MTAEKPTEAVVGSVRRETTAPTALTTLGSVSLTSWTAPADCWVHFAGVYFQTATTPPPGRYYVSGTLVPGVQGGPPLQVFGGYFQNGRSPGNTLGLFVKAGDQIQASVACGSNGSASDFAGIVVFWSETIRPATGAIVIEPPGSGQGEVFGITVAQPAAGANPANSSVAAGKPVRQCVRGFRGTFTSDATVAIRMIRIEFTQGGVNVGLTTSGYQQTAGLAIDYGAGIANGQSETTTETIPTGGAVVMGLPLQVMAAPYNYAVKAVGIDANDQWSATHWLIEEWAIPTP